MYTLKIYGEENIRVSKKLMAHAFRTAARIAEKAWVKGSYCTNEAKNKPAKDCKYCMQGAINKALQDLKIPVRVYDNSEFLTKKLTRVLVPSKTRNSGGEKFKAGDVEGFNDASLTTLEDVTGRLRAAARALEHGQG